MVVEQNPNAFQGVIIGLVSSFGSIILVSIVVFSIWISGCVGNGRILLERMGRPGEYDDEQAFARDEAEALENMDDMARAEYMRAKGTWGIDWCYYREPHHTVLIFVLFHPYPGS